MSAKAQIRSKNQERVTFVIEGEDQGNVVLPVAALFDELKVIIEAIWMVRHKRTGNPHLSVTVQTEPAGMRTIENYLSKIVGILSVKMQTGAEAFVPSSPRDAE